MPTDLEQGYKKLSDFKIAGIFGGIGVACILGGLLFLKLRRLLLAFIIGSSVASTIFSLSYFGLANYYYKGLDNYEVMAIYVPLFYGAFNVLSTGLTRHFGKFKYAPILIPLLVGGTQGVIFNIIGTFALGNLPVKNFQFKEKDQWQIYLYAFIYYAAVYGIVITFLNQLYFLY